MSLRVQTVSQHYESRPPPRDTKMFGCHQQNRNRIDSNHSATSLMTTSSCASTMISTSPSSTPLYHSALATESIIDNNMMMNSGRRRVSLPSTSKSSFSAPNVMQWMQKDCPKDLVPLILAFAGPQKVAAIGKTNRFWYQVMDQEETWSRLCECLYKVRRMITRGVVKSIWTIPFH